MLQKRTFVLGCIQPLPSKNYKDDIYRICSACARSTTNAQKRKIKQAK